jgi:hypothetical protein
MRENLPSTMKTLLTLSIIKTAIALAFSAGAASNEVRVIVGRVVSFTNAAGRSFSGVKLEKLDSVGLTYTFTHGASGGGRIKWLDMTPGELDRLGVPKEFRQSAESAVLAEQERRAKAKLAAIEAAAKLAAIEAEEKEYYGVYGKVLQKLTPDSYLIYGEIKHDGRVSTDYTFAVINCRSSFVDGDTFFCSRAKYDRDTSYVTVLGAKRTVRVFDCNPIFQK